MRFVDTPLAGAWLIEPERLVDERGYFARVFDALAFAERGIDPAVVQASVSFNPRVGTLRGMHFAAGEAKLVRCTRGAVFDVIVDLREDSPTRCAWYGVELSADNGRQLVIPDGLAHGFQTLAADTEVSYQMTVAYDPAAARGVRWDDPAFEIEWPPAPPEGRLMSARDASYPDFAP